MSLRRLLTLSLCAALGLVWGCAKPGAPVEVPDAAVSTGIGPSTTTAAPDTASAPETDAAAPSPPPGAAATDGVRISYDKLGVSVAVPSGWNETPVPAGAPKDVVIGLQRGDGPFPAVTITGLDPKTAQSVRKKDGKEITLDAFIDQWIEGVMKGEGTDKPVLVEQSAWSAAGISAGKRMRLKGLLDEQEQTQGVFDVRVGESTDGSLYLVWAGGANEDDLAEASSILDGAEFTGATIGLADSVPAAGDTKE